MSAKDKTTASYAISRSIDARLAFAALKAAISSIGRRGNPYDNAQAESFMKTLKVEAVYLMAYETFEDVTADLPILSVMYLLPREDTLPINNHSTLQMRVCNLWQFVRSH